MPQIDRMTRFITIQKLTESQNDFNEVVEEWNDWKKVAAEVRWLPARERFSAGRTIEIYACAFFIRYLTGLNGKFYRVHYDGKFFDIIGIKEDNRGKRDFLEITAEAKDKDDDEDDA